MVKHTKLNVKNVSKMLVKEMIVAEGSIDTRFTGTRVYKRAIQVYKIQYKLFTKTFLKIFERTYPNTLEAMKNILGNADGS